MRIVSAVAAAFALSLGVAGAARAGDRAAPAPVRATSTVDVIDSTKAVDDIIARVRADRTHQGEKKETAGAAEHPGTRQPDRSAAKTGDKTADADSARASREAAAELRAERKEQQRAERAERRLERAERRAREANENRRR